MDISSSKIKFIAKNKNFGLDTVLLFQKREPEHPKKCLCRHWKITHVLISGEQLVMVSFTGVDWEMADMRSSELIENLESCTLPILPFILFFYF